MLFRGVCVVLFCLSLVTCVPIDQQDSAVPASTDVDTHDGQVNYFMHYGYMGKKNPDPRVAELSLEEQFQHSIRDFQQFAGLEVTGEMDEATVQKMKEPRCGMQDKTNMGDIARRKRRFAREGSRWTSKSLSYRILKYSNKLTRQQVDTEIGNAFKVWSDVTPLDFYTKTENPVDFDVEFGTGEHGDGIPFDGPGNTLAHAFFPRYGGDLHMDDDERWTDGSRGINLHQVATHEIGHSLGLSHSDVQGALMQPFYSYQSNFMLHDDDIKGIQSLYGSRPTVAPTTARSTTTRRTTTTTPRSPPTTTTTRKPSATTTTARPTTTRPTTTRPTTTRTTTTRTTTRTTTSRPGDVPHHCTDGRIDAITMTPSGNTYAFRGSQYFQLTSTGISDGFPRAMAGDWGSMTGPLDTAVFLDAEYDFQWKVSQNSGRFYFYRSWVLVRSAVTWFFKGSECWKYEDNYTTGPFPIADTFNGLPNDLSAAFVWSGNGKLYFIKGDQYYRVDKTTLTVDRGYPKAASVWGIPGNGIDAALQWMNKRTYFFVDQQYYRFNDQAFQVDTTYPHPYPRPIGQWWFGCPAQTGNLEDGHNMVEEMGDEQEFADITSSVTSQPPQISDTTAADVNANGVAMTTPSMTVFLLTVALWNTLL